MTAALTALWAIPWVRRAALYGGIALALIALVLAIYLRGKAAGKIAVQIDAMKRNLDTEKRMKNATATAPSDLDGARKRMRDGTY